MAFTLDGVEQNGDKFDVTYTVYNNGNAPVPEGRALRLNLLGLYVDLAECGVEDDVLFTADISGLKPGEGGTYTRSVEIPWAVFEKYGCDAVNMDYIQADGGRLDSCDDVYVTMTAPVNFQVNEGERLLLKPEESTQLTVSFEGPFLGEERVAYTVADTSVATVSNGVLTAQGEGTTTVTATLLPAGCTDSFVVTVSENPQDLDSVTVTAAEIAAAQGDTIPVRVSDAVVKLDTAAMKKASRGGRDAVVTVKNNDDGTVTVNVTVDGRTVPADVKAELPAQGGSVLARILPDGTEEIVKKSLVEDGRVYAVVPAGARVKLVTNEKHFLDVAAGSWFAEPVALFRKNLQHGAISLCRAGGLQRRARALPGRRKRPLRPAVDHEPRHACHGALPPGERQGRWEESLCRRARGRLVHRGGDLGQRGRHRQGHRRGLCAQRARHPRADRRHALPLRRLSGP